VAERKQLTREAVVSLQQFHRFPSPVAPKTGGSLSCHPSFLCLFPGPRVGPVQAMYKPCATKIQSRVIVVRSARKAVMQKVSVQ
jgi:hypothetical protein